MAEVSSGFSQDGAAAVKFIEELKLPPQPRRARGAVAAPAQFDSAADGSYVVGSGVVSFAAGVAAPTRELIVNSLLLAQLAANQKAPRNDLRAWHDAYFDTLANLGWVIQERGFSEHRESGDDFEAHNAILSIAYVVLGPAAPALAVIQSTLEAMKAMSSGSWMTIFKRETQAAPKTPHFEITAAEPSDDGVRLSLMAFELEAKSNLTQVLFFKFRSADITFRHASGRVMIDSKLLASVRGAMAKKLAAYTRHYVETLPI
jgi:hypothetical protein